MPSVERIKNDVLQKAMIFLRDKFGMDDDYAVGSFKVTEKEITVDMDGPHGISIKAGIPLTTLYPPRDCPEGQGELFVPQDARTPEQMVRATIEHLEGLTDASGVVITPADLGEEYQLHDCNNCRLAIVDPDTSLPVGCNRGDMDEVACKAQVYGYWVSKEAEIERGCATCIYGMEDGCCREFDEDEGEMCSAENNFEFWMPAPADEGLERGCDNCRFDGSIGAITIEGEDVSAFCCLAEIPEGETCNVDNNYQYFEQIKVPEDPEEEPATEHDCMTCRYLDDLDGIPICELKAFDDEAECDGINNFALWAPMGEETDGGDQSEGIADDGAAEEPVSGGNGGAEQDPAGGAGDVHGQVDDQGQDVGDGAPSARKRKQRARRSSVSESE